MRDLICTLGIIGVLFSCTPERYEYQEPGFVDMNTIAAIKLYLSHYQLLADGKAELEFHPILITQDSFEVADSRIDHSLIEYHSLSGDILEENFSTSSSSLIGKEINVYATIKGTQLRSDTVSFTVVDPSALDQCTEITIPVVFHLIQSDADIASYGGEIPAERIQALFDKMNNTFSGVASNNAVGVDTKIRFKPALYDPYGATLAEPGINRIYVSEVMDEARDQYASFITAQRALWDYTKYLNIWLISDTKGEYSTFYRTISTSCIPRYVNTVSDLEQAPLGLSLSVLPEEWNPEPKEVGVIYKLQSILTMVRTFGEKEENELTNCLGYYLGLLPTWSENSTLIPDDYCIDTYNYYGNSQDKVNITSNKLLGDYMFLSENIMDDPTGVHRSITLQQALRMHWFLNHCPERSAWKSDFAFTGNN